MKDVYELNKKKKSANEGKLLNFLNLPVLKKNFFFINDHDRSKNPNDGYFISQQKKKKNLIVMSSLFVHRKNERERKREEYQSDKINVSVKFYSYFHISWVGWGSRNVHRNRWRASKRVKHRIHFFFMNTYIIRISRRGSGSWLRKTWK